jgi:hypothetical protein
VDFVFGDLDDVMPMGPLTKTRKIDWPKYDQATSQLKYSLREFILELDKVYVVVESVQLYSYVQ